MFPQIPFSVSESKVEGFSGELRKVFIDKDGNVYRCLAISTALNGDVFADGQVAFFKDDDTATNAPTEADDTSNPRFAGVACGALAESPSTTTYYGLFRFRGLHDTLKCAASVAIGDGLATSLVTGGTPVVAEAQRLPKANVTNGGAYLASHLGGSTFIGSARTAVSGGTCKAFLNGNG